MNEMRGNSNARFLEIASESWYFGSRKSGGNVHMHLDTILKAFFKIRAHLRDLPCGKVWHETLWLAALPSTKFLESTQALQNMIPESQAATFITILTRYPKRFWKFEVVLENSFAEKCDVEMTEWARFAQILRSQTLPNPSLRTSLVRAVRGHQ